MSENLLVLKAQAEIMCDACGAVRRSDVDETGTWDLHFRFSRQLAFHHGWKVYVGRTRRNYCPKCDPRPGHKMRLLYGHVVVVAEEVSDGR